MWESNTIAGWKVWISLSAPRCSLPSLLVPLPPPLVSADVSVGVFLPHFLFSSYFLSHANSTISSVEGQLKSLRLVRKTVMFPSTGTAGPRIGLGHPML